MADAREIAHFIETIPDGVGGAEILRRCHERFPDAEPGAVPIALAIVVELRRLDLEADLEK